ncbi:hypothetical protein L2E82_10227 [Cichorium intybus]|uniref:Uncharacterized protein n=1 Tax=Cichorium intybus TaxID=13427 RepID=A0ACB9GA28_CICIN|nr:hypothetical protein L2E82_10227 [Cichorium intybus]
MQILCIFYKKNATKCFYLRYENIETRVVVFLLWVNNFIIFFLNNLKKKLTLKKYETWPSGKRCFVVSSNGTTVSKLRNGSLLHRFPSSLPNGARTREGSRSAQSYCILDCIFHEVLNYLMVPERCTTVL